MANSESNAEKNAEVILELARLTEVKLNPPATELEIKEAEKELGFDLPKEIKQYLRLFNGEVSNSSDKVLGMIAGGTLHSTDQIVEWYKFCQDELPNWNLQSDCKRLGKTEKSMRNWIPITWGYDLEFLFFDNSHPKQDGGTGCHGQIFLSSPVSCGTCVVGENLANVLERIKASLSVTEDEEIEWDLTGI